MDMIRNCIYRFLNKNNEIIYIGKAKELKSRLNGHNHLPKECYNEKFEVEYTEFKTEDDMDFAERYYIMKFNPKYNTILSDKDFNITSTELDYKPWNKFRSTENNSNLESDNKIDIDTQINLLSDDLKILRIKIETVHDCFRNDTKNKSMEDMLSNLKGKELELDKALMKILKIKYSNEEEWVLKELIRYNIYDKSELIKNGIKKIEDKFFEKCKNEIIKNGYYKEEIYELIDFEFYCNQPEYDWRYLLNGEFCPYSTILKGYTIDEELKNRIVNYIIDNIQNRIENKFGKLEKEIIMLDNRSDIHMIDFSIFKYRKFLKPFMVYRINSN